MRALEAEGWRTIALVRRPFDTQTWAQGTAITVPGEWTIDVLVQAIERLRPRAVINLVGAGVDPATRQPEQLEAVNVGLARRLAELAGAVGAGAFINIGSGTEYLPVDTERLDETAAENTADPYGRSKAKGGHAALEACRKLGICGAHLRLFGMFGESERPHRLLPTIVRAHCAGGRAQLSAGFQVRDWLYERDIGSALAALLAAALSGRIETGIYNLGSGQGHSVRRFAEMVAEVLGARPDFLEFGALGLRPGEGVRLVADASRFRAATGWRPDYDLRVGLSEAIARMTQQMARTG
jgi:GDP-4-dehydro-6-deoxy-D-mannose reductase